MINMPEKKQGDVSKWAIPVLSTVGGIVGSLIPGAGTLAGAAAGSAVGGAVGGVAKAIDDNKPEEGVASAGQVAQAAAALQNSSEEDETPSDTSAMQRRLDSQSRAQPNLTLSSARNATSDTKALKDGLEALQSLPPEQREVYGPKIAGAYNRQLRREFMG